MAVSEEILEAALYGPEVKEAKIYEPNSFVSHEFTVKPVSYRVYKNEVTVFGQLSHHLSMDIDNQLWFTFKKSGCQTMPYSVQHMVVEKQERRLAKTIVKLNPISVAIDAYFGTDADMYFYLLKELANDLLFIDMNSGWEKAAGNFLNELAKHITIPIPISVSGLKLFENENLSGESLLVIVGKNIVRSQEMGWTWNDKASSLVASVPEGKKLELFQRDAFRGLKLELGPGMHIIRDLKIHKLGDTITSVRWLNAEPTNRPPID